MRPDQFHIHCNRCKRTFPGDTPIVICPWCGRNGLLKSRFAKSLTLNPSFSNLYRYENYLPVQTRFENLPSISGCYQSRYLARELKLKRLWILFSGYWPEKKASNASCSFKEFEAIGLLSSACEQNRSVPLICSAGNTALSVIFIASKTGRPAIIVVPEAARKRFRLPLAQSNPRTFLIELKNARYKDCMEFAASLPHRLPGIAPSGGVFNAVRRDFLGIPLVHAAHAMGEIPKHYFQAVGSGSGAIAAMEAAQKLSRTRKFIHRAMHLHLVQNLPFTPIFNLWNHMPVQDDTQADQVLAAVLTNPSPPFETTGGINDLLRSTHGSVYGVSNHDILDAQKIFQQLEGCDIQYPSAACVAGLFQAVKKGTISKADTILLHITGGGQKRLQQDKKLFKVDATLTLEKDDVQTATIELDNFLSILNRKKA